ncbi:MAG TPA: acyl-CoA thioesterase domain-containing protein [Acidimicrobiales bacterium]|nr:acyl-CoA thioesterase domain-containing protein [Acidimicrobiales bacterium]
MNPAFERFVSLLELEVLDRDLFRGANPGSVGPGRVFGGQVAGQAMQAAAATVEVEHHPHSLHASFLRPGRRGTPIIYQVDRIRDGRSFTTRRVVGIQHGEAIFSLTASFHVLEASPEHQLPLPPDVPPPDRCEREEPGQHHIHHHPFDIRELEPPAVVDGRPAASTRRMWVRTDGRLPDEPAVHASVVAFLSDMGPVGAARRALRRKGEAGEMMGASLDHTLWFHRPLRADEWLLYDLEAVAVAGARGLSRGTLSTEDGVLVASVAQEVLLRPIQR